MYQIRLNGRYVFGSPNLNLLNQVKLRYYPSGEITFNKLQFNSTIQEDPLTVIANVLNLNSAFAPSYGGTGTLWTDLTVNANNATIFNGVTWDGQSFLFNGTNQYANAAHSASLAITSAISITIWIKSGFTGDGGLVSKSVDSAKYFAGSGEKVYEIGRFGGQLYFQISSGLATSLIALSVAQTNAIYNNAWNQLTFTWDGTTAVNGIKAYTNGVLTTQATSSIANIQNLVSTFNIGGASGYFTNGRIGVVLLSNFALTAVQDLANHNKIRPYFP
jgi:hypothetical protein